MISPYTYRNSAPKYWHKTCRLTNVNLLYNLGKYLFFLFILIIFSPRSAEVIESGNKCVYTWDLASYVCQQWNPSSPFKALQCKYRSGVPSLQFTGSLNVIALYYSVKKRYQLSWKQLFFYIYLKFSFSLNSPVSSSSQTISPSVLSICGFWL